MCAKARLVAITPAATSQTQPLVGWRPSARRVPISVWMQCRRERVASIVVRVAVSAADRLDDDDDCVWISMCRIHDAPRMQVPLFLSLDRPKI